MWCCLQLSERCNIWFNQLLEETIFCFCWYHQNPMSANSTITAQCRWHSVMKVVWCHLVSCKFSKSVPQWTTSTASPYHRHYNDWLYVIKLRMWSYLAYDSQQTQWVTITEKKRDLYTSHTLRLTVADDNVTQVQNRCYTNPWLVMFMTDGDFLTISAIYSFNTFNF